MSDELKQCPFCGNGDMEELAYGTLGETEYIVCSQCEVEVCESDWDKVDLDAKWNHRPIEDALRSKLQKAREALEEIVNNSVPGGHDQNIARQAIRDIWG